MNWLTATISDVCQPTVQQDPAKSGRASFRYIDISGLDRDAKVIAGAQLLPSADAPSRARKVVKAGDILVSTVRPNLNAVAYVPEHLDGEVASTGFAVLRAQPQLVDPKFLYYWVQHASFVDFLVANATGANYPAVTDGVVKRSPLPLPVILEQRRIVEILEQADGLRQLRREADAKAARILPALFLHIFGAPDQWKESEPLGQLVLIKSGGTPSKGVAEFWRGTIPWVSPKDMKRDEIEDAEDHVSESAIAQTAVQMVPTDSVLIVVRGMILARDVPVAIARRPVTINQDMKALVLTDKRLDSLYLFAALKVQAARLLAEVTTAAHGTKKLETTRLASLPVPIPAPAELQAFSSAYRQLLAVDRLRAAASPRIDSLFSLLLQRAFSSQLTAKWREPRMKELLAETAQQARALNLSAPRFADA